MIASIDLSEVKQYNVRKNAGLSTTSITDVLKMFQIVGEILPDHQTCYSFMERGLTLQKYQVEMGSSSRLQIILNLIVLRLFFSHLFIPHLLTMTPSGWLCLWLVRILLIPRKSASSFSISPPTWKPKTLFKAARFLSWAVWWCV